MKDEDETLSSRLLEWAKDHGRRFPWRTTLDPYGLAVAEVLLQRTKAKDVEPIWEEVASRYPNPASLREAADHHIQSIVSGLGLGIQRSQRLKSMADGILKNGYLSRLPGLGPYGSGILRLAMGQEISEPPVDGNIARVISRYFGLEFDRGEARKKRPVRSAVSSLLRTQCMPAGKIKVVYALVDLGAKICTPGKPSCTACPLANTCSYPPAKVSLENRESC